MTDKRKKSLYMRDSMLREVDREANRLDRSTSWLIAYAWQIAREEIFKLQAHEGPKGEIDGLHR